MTTRSKSTTHRRLGASFRSFMEDGGTPDAYEKRLSQAWAAILDGRGSKEDADLALGDLFGFSGFFTVSDPNADPQQMVRREGRREVAARIAFLIDLPYTYMTDLRRAALDEMQVTSDMDG